MSPEELLLRTFVNEATESLASAEALLLELEERIVDPKLLNQLMGVTHTIKGGAATVGLASLSEFVHEMEGVLDDLRQERVVASSALFNQLFESLDAIRRNLVSVANGDSQQHEMGEHCARLHTWRLSLGATQLAPDGEEQVAGLHLGEYDWVRIDVLRKQQKPLYRLEIQDGERASEDALRPALHCLHAVGDVVTHNAGSDAKGLPVLVVLFGSSQHREVVEQTLRDDGFVVSSWTDFSERPRSKPATQAPRSGQGSQQIIKVDVQRVDRLMEMVGELAIVESMVKSNAEIAGLKSPRVRASMRLLTRISLDLQDTALCLRMVPIRGEFRKMERVVRDLARSTGKKMRLELQGEATELDRAIVERLGEPLLHLVRNAVDHGIEPPAERGVHGKPEVSVISIKAAHQGGAIMVEVSDDGRGLDREAILARAIERGVVESDARLNETETLALIFSPGFSMANEVTEISGRGVGLDIVRRVIESIRGRITVSSVAGRGTTFQMILPLTLAIINGTVVRCGDERYVVPTLSIVECLRPDSSSIVPYGSEHDVLRLRERIIPLLRLRQLLKLAAEEASTRPLILVVESAGRLVGLVVDDVLLQQQIVIKSLDTPAADRRLFSGAAILSDGRVGLILNVDNLAMEGLHRADGKRHAEAYREGAASEVNP